MLQAEQLELLCRLTHATSLQEVCDLACQITGNPIFISDMSHTILAHTRDVKIDDPVWQNNVVSARLERNTLRQDREVGSVHISSTEQHRPVLVEDDYLPQSRIINSLIHEHRAVGVVVLTAYLQPLKEGDLELVELISAFVLPLLLRERFRVSADARGVENYFIKLLGGSRETREEVNQHLAVLKYTPSPHSYVVTLCTADNTGGVSGDLEQIRQEVANCLHAPAFLYNTMLVCVYGSNVPVNSWPNQVPGLAELLQRWSLIAGVSRELDHIAQLRESYLQAQAVMEKGRQLDRFVPCYQFDSLASYLLFDRIPVSELEQYSHKRIQALWEYDQAHGTDLCITLQVYLEQAKSLNRTAEILYIHRNTVRYRINRCMELLEDRLEDGNEIFAYIFSLRILEYRTKVQRAFPGFPKPRPKE